MSEILDDIVKSDLISAIETNLVEMFSLSCNWDKAEVHDGKDLFWTITDIPFPLFNSILRARLEPNEIDGSIKAAINRSKLMNVPILWWTGPATQPFNLGVHLMDHNFRYQGDSSGMAIDLMTLKENPHSLPELSIQTVDDEESLMKWCNVLKIGFGMPEYVANAFFHSFSSIGLNRQSPIRHYIGLLKGEPVAVSSLFLGTGIAGIYNVTTIRYARRHGVGTAMTIKPLEEARNMGYRIATLQSLKMGLGVYRRLGFQEYCKLSRYIWMSDRQANIN